MKNATEYGKVFSDTRGFTLLEVMLCVAILAFITISLFSVQSGSISLVNKNKFVQQGPAFAEKALAIISADLKDPDQTQGDFAPDYPEITWTCQVTEVNFEDLDFTADDTMAGLKKIDIRIKDASGSNTFEMTTWRRVHE
ncbi:MAG: type II secretion system GspH family protein [Proteobacteria bacterium]|nr:type II secretion system GspH family protein [Pseudomonadota bacterium]